MYMVFFHGSHTKRYDDPEEMGEDIASWLSLHPKGKVTVQLYI